MRTTLSFLSRGIFRRSHSTMDTNKQPALDFLDFVNASPTRKLPHLVPMESVLTGSSFPCGAIRQGSAGQSWL